VVAELLVVYSHVTTLAVPFSQTNKSCCGQK